MNNVIDLAATRAARAARATQLPMTVVQLGGQNVIVYLTSDGRAAAYSEADHERMMAPKVRDLPFCSKERDEYGHPVSYWAVDDETAFSKGAYQLGKKWGADLFDAARNERGRGFELLIEELVADGIRRARKGGSGSRKALSTAADGVLAGFAEALQRRK